MHGRETPGHLGRDDVIAHTLAAQYMLFDDPFHRERRHFPVGYQCFIAFQHLDDRFGIRQALHDAFMANFDVDIFFQEQYVNKRRDKLEVTYEVYHLYGIPRVPLAEVIRSAKDKAELRVFRHQLGGSDAARRKLSDHSTTPAPASSPTITRPAGPIQWRSIAIFMK